MDLKGNVGFGAWIYTPMKRFKNIKVILIEFRSLGGYAWDLEYTWRFIYLYIYLNIITYLVKTLVYLLVAPSSNHSIFVFF